MDYLIVYCCLFFISAYQSVGGTEIYEENELWMFYVNNKTVLEAQRRYNESNNTKLSVSYLKMTTSFHKDIETFCESLTKTNVVALLLPPNIDERIEFTLAAKHLAIPVLNFAKPSKNTQHLHINLNPRPVDSLPHVMEMVQRTCSFPAVICYTKTYDELKHLINATAFQDVKFYHLTSGLSSKKRTQAVAKILAKIRNLKIYNLIIYVDQKDLKEFFVLGEMMQMMESKYRWIIPWTIKRNENFLPKNTFILQPKNSTKIQDILSDAVDFINQAFRGFMDKNKDVPDVRCFDKVHPSFGQKFHRYMIQQSLIGKTGYLAFDERGNRINAEYEVVDPKNNLIIATAPSIPQSKLPKKIRAITALSKPFVYLNQMVRKKHNCGIGLVCHVYPEEGNQTLQFCCEGYIIDVIHLLQTDLGVDIEIHVSKDGKYGSLDEKNHWDGMIGKILRNEADIAIADLTITDERLRVVDFTYPFMEIGVGVLVRVDRQGVTEGIWTFLQPVAPMLWIITFLAISFMGILFWAMEKIAFRILDKFATHNDEKNELQGQTSKKFSFAASLHYSWSTVVRTRDKVIRPSNTSAKIGAISLALCFLVFITTYTAQLAAFLVAEVHVTPITRGIQDSQLRNPSSDLKIATVKGSSVERFFQTNPDPDFVNIWRLMMNNNVPTIDVGVKRLMASEIDVLIGDYNTMVYKAAQDPNCSLRVIGEPFFKSGYGIALQKNSTWTPVFSQKLLQYEKFDTFLELAHRWMKTSCDRNEDEANSVNFNTFHRMTVYDVSGMFVVVAVAVGLSCIFLAAEFYYKRRYCTE